MKDIILIGSGNVATHLAVVLNTNGYNIIQIFSRKLEQAKQLAKQFNTDYTNTIENLKTADLIIVAVKDDAITHLVNQIKDTPIVHTSGSINIDVFNNSFSNCGVFYPLQTFNKEVTLNFKEIPICIEANNTAFEQELLAFAATLSNTVVKMDSEQRQQLHIAAVFACNFSNQLFTIADDVLATANIDFSILLPLIKQTITKLENNKPRAVQTGPAIRKDMTVINKHLNKIENPETKQLYSLITKSIINTHE